jgi:hypothetical protein
MSRRGGRQRGDTTVNRFVDSGEQMAILIQGELGEALGRA